MEAGTTMFLDELNARVGGNDPTFYNTGDGVENQWGYSINGGVIELIDDPVDFATSSQIYSVDLSQIDELQNLRQGETIAFYYYASGQTVNGTWGFRSDFSYDEGLSLRG